MITQIIKKSKPTVKTDSTLCLSQTFRDEWIHGSAIHSGIVDLNVKWVEGEEAMDALLYAVQKKDRTNTGVPTRKLLESYGHVWAGGIEIRGVDLSSEYSAETDEWCQFKCANPRTDYDKDEFGRRIKGKLRKYESPPKTPTKAIALKVPSEIAYLISEKYGVEYDPTQDTSFWYWVLNNPSIPIIITEGAKKAGSLLSLGFAAVALPGIWNGARREEDPVTGETTTHKLIPDLQVVAEASKGREIVFAFDEDAKLSTRKSVEGAIGRAGWLFISSGAKVSKLKWNPSVAKGVDDLIVHSPEAFQSVFDARIDLGLLARDRRQDISKYVTRQVDKRYLELEDLAGSESAQLVFFKSAKGTGKTVLLGSFTEDAHLRQQKVLNISHRRMLATSLGKKFNISDAEDKDKYLLSLGQSICVDSLQSNCAAKFNVMDWDCATLILDEVEQLLWHMLSAATEVRSRRSEVLNNFRDLIEHIINSGGKIIAADADLSPLAINFLLSLCGEVSTFVLENTHRPSENRIAYYDESKTPGEIINRAVQGAIQGEKVLLHLTGQKVSSRWGTKTVETLFRKQLIHGNKKIIRVDAETVTTPGHPAFRVMQNPVLLNDYDVVITSPVIETGVSLDRADFHFDGVYGIGYGVNTAEAFCQSLERYRGDCPRYIWVSACGLNRIAGGQTSVKGLVDNMRQADSAVLFSLTDVRWQNKGLVDEVTEDVIEDAPELQIDIRAYSMEAWAKKASGINQDSKTYRKTIMHLLQKDGYFLVHIGDEGNSQEVVIDSDEDSKIIRDEQLEEEIKLLAAFDTSDYKEEVLKKKKEKTVEERRAEQKIGLAKRWGSELANEEEVIKSDMDGDYSKARRLYFLEKGMEFARKKDEITIKRSKFSPDRVKAAICPKIKVYELLGVTELLKNTTGTQITSRDLKEFHDKIIFNSAAVETILGFTPHRKSAILAFRSVIESIGYTIEFSHRDSKGERLRFYNVEGPPDWYAKAMDVWFQQDSSKSADTPQLLTQESESVQINVIDLIN